MTNARMTVGILFASMLCVLNVGCTDELKAKESQIALIEDQNRRLAGDLATVRSENELLAQERERLRQDLLAAQREGDQLRGELADASSREPVAEGWQAVPGGHMIAIPGSVLFAPGKEVLRDSGKNVLADVASAVRGQYGGKDIFVFGHTDDTPIRKSGWKDNFELSAQRALTVVRHLQERGISPTSLVACGAGEHRPEVPNSGEANRARNRRVEIFAVDPIR